MTMPTIALLGDNLSALLRYSQQTKDIYRAFQSSKSTRLYRAFVKYQELSIDSMEEQNIVYE